MKIKSNYFTLAFIVLTGLVFQKTALSVDGPGTGHIKGVVGQVSGLSRLRDPETFKKHGVECDNEDGSCRFEKMALYLDSLVGGSNRALASELEARYPGSVAVLTNPNRKQIVRRDNSIFLPPSSSGYIGICTVEDYRKKVEAAIDRFYAELGDYQKSSKKANSYWASMKGRLRDRQGLGAEELASDGARKRAFGVIGHLKHSLGVTNGQLFSHLYSDLRLMDTEDFKNIKNNQKTLLKVMIVSPLVAIAAPVAMFVASGAPLAIAGSGTLSGTGFAIPSTTTLATTSVVGAGIGGLDDQLLQRAELYDGTRSKIDWRRTAAVSGTSAVAAPIIFTMPQLGVALGTYGAIDQSHGAVTNIHEKHYATATMNVLNTSLSIWGTVGAAKRNLSQVVGATHTASQDPVATPESQAKIEVAVTNAANGTSEQYVKDAPILGYKITSDRFEDIPEAIRMHLGGVDQTKYTPEYLRQNIGSFIALQMKDGKTPDFYIVGLSTKQAKYLDSSLTDVVAKNPKLFGQVKNVDGLSNLLEKDPNIGGFLKTSPVQMTRMSTIGFAPDQEVAIESPWGIQKKPAGFDAFLTKNEKGQWYMINTDEQGMPLSYIRAKN